MPPRIWGAFFVFLIESNFDANRDDHCGWPWNGAYSYADDDSLSVRIVV